MLLHSSIYLYVWLCMRDQETHTYIQRDGKRRRREEHANTEREGKRENEHTLMEGYEC